MSLPALALLYAMTGALREVAPEWVRVERSPRDALKLIEGDEGRALVAVYTGDEVHTVTRRKLFDGPRKVELAVQVLLPPRVMATFEGGSASLDAHTSGADVAFTVVHRLIETVLMAPAAGSWGEILQWLVPTFEGAIERRPFIVEAGAVVIPGADISLPCDLGQGSPPIGGELQPFWAAFLARMRADDRSAGAASLVEAMVRGRPVPEWRAEQVRAGLSRAEGAALGIGSLAGVEATPPFTGGMIHSPGGDTVVRAGDGGGR